MLSRNDVKVEDDISKKYFELKVHLISLGVMNGVVSANEIRSEIVREWIQIVNQFTVGMEDKPIIYSEAVNTTKKTLEYFILTLRVDVLADNNLSTFEEMLCW